MLSTGNPRLDDEDKHQLTVQLQLPKHLNISISGGYSGNSISPYWYEDSQGRVVQTYGNNGTNRDLNIGFDYTLIFKKLWLSFMGSESYSYSRTADHQRTERLFGYITAQTTLSIGRVGTISLLASYQHTHSSGMEHRSNQPFSFMTRTNWKLFKKRLEVEFEVSNWAGFHSKSRHDIHTTAFDQYMVTRSNMLPMTLTLRWTLGNFKVKPVRQARQGAIIDDLKTEETP